MIALVRGIWPDTRLPCLILIPLVGLSLFGLAESPLNPLAFSHTSLAFALSLVGLNLLVRQRIVPALAMVGLLVNIHLLTAAYLAALTGAWALWRLRTLPRRRFLCGLGAAILLALPMAWPLWRSSGGFDAEWIALVELRSAHHVFSSTWWRVGDPTVGLFALWIGWAALARGLAGGNSRHTDPWLAAAAALMAVGWLGSELVPVPLIMRAQLFRISGYVVVVALLLTVRAADLHLRPGPEFRPAVRLPIIIATLLFAAIVWLPFGRPLAAPALLLAAWLGCANRRLAPGEALVVGSAVVVVTLSDIHLHTGFWQPALASAPAVESVLWLAAIAVAVFSTRWSGYYRWLLPLGALSLMAGGLFFRSETTTVPDHWQDIQRQTRRHTPLDAMILTPTRQSGFRLGSRRAIVGEWRDGTQQFFDPEFAVLWSQRMAALEPDTTSDYTAAEWMQAAETWGADYLVLPNDPQMPLVRVAENEAWMLCRPERPPPPPLPEPPDNAIDPEDWLEQERFMVEVVKPNLDRYRTSKLTLRVLAPEGNPLPHTQVEVQQTGRDFHIGSSLNHFAEPAAHSREFKAPLVHERELEMFLQVFNYSVIPYSAKWATIEPVEGQRGMEALDRYVEWAVQHQVAIEFHFVTGYEPPWLRNRTPAEQQAALLRHAEDLIERYGDRISLWQIVNERRLQSLAAPVFEMFEEKLPDAQLGVSHCARFYSSRQGARRLRDLMRGWDSVEELQRQGARVDYFGVHAHRPFGTWWDPRTIYEVLDLYQARNMRVRVTETGISYAGKIEGSVLEGEWNEERQADYLRRFLTVLYSHPNVDGVNFWGFGPHNWQSNIGLLDEQYEPRPAFLELYQLVNQQWRTHERLRTNRTGTVRFSGFHGEYRIHARLPDGSRASAEFRLGPETPAEISTTLAAEHLMTR